MRVKRVISLISVFLFVAFLSLPTISSVIFGEKKPTTFEEKRELDQFPLPFSNFYFSNLSRWYADHMPFRMNIITAQLTLKQSSESFYRDHFHQFISDIFIPDWYSASKINEKEYYAPLEDGRIVYGRDEWLFYNDEENLKYYIGDNILSEVVMAEWRASYEELNKQCLNRGIKLIVMHAPNKEQVYDAMMPSYYLNSEKKRVQRFTEYMTDSGVTVLYPLTELKAETDYLTYYKQDTHWNYIGAYIGVSCIYNELGMKVTPLEANEIVRRQKSGGDLSNFCGFATTYEDYDVQYKPEIITEIDENGIIHSSSENAHTVFLISDSFRTAIQGYLSKDFQKSVIIHRAALDQDWVADEIQNLSRGDVLVLLAVERYDYQNYEACSSIIDIMNAAM